MRSSGRWHGSLSWLPPFDYDIAVLMAMFFWLGVMFGRLPS